MKRSQKILLIGLMLFIIFIPTMVKADSFNLNFTANKTTLKPEETVELNLNISNIDAGEEGINTLEAKLEYDTSIFEEVTQSSIQSLNNWSLTYNNEETESKGKILAVIIVSGVTQNQDIGKIKLKVKKGVNYTDTTVKLTGITSNNGQELIKENDKQVSFKVGNKQVQNQDTDKTNNNTTTNTTTSNLIEQQPNLSKGPLPQTGSRVGNAVLTLAAVIIAVVAIVIYIQYRKVNK